MKRFLERKKTKGRILSLYCITLGVICQAFWPSAGAFAANANLFSFKDYTADYYLSQAEDGTSRLRVVEQFTASFPSSNQNHGITRVIPYTNQDGQNLTMVSDDYLEINLWHNGEEERPYKVENGDGYFTVYIGSPSKYVHGENTYTLEYEFRNVITSFTEDGRSWQELYWDTNGNDWSQNFKQVTATVHFEDEAIADSFTGDISCYVGRYGSSDQSRCDVSRIEDGVKFSAENLRPAENLTFDLEFNADTFAMPKQAYDYRLILGLVFMIISGLGFGMALLFISGQVADKRKYYKELFIKPEYTPLKDLTVAEMTENYIGKGVYGQTKVATMLEMAVQGKIELIKLEAEGTKRKTKNLWRIHIKSLELSPEQAILLKILIGENRPLNLNDEITITMHTANAERIALGNQYLTATQEELRRQGYQTYDERKSKNNKYVAARNPINALFTVLCFWMILSIASCGFVFADVPPYRHLIGGVPLTVGLIILFIAIFFGTFHFAGKLSPFFSHTEKGIDTSRYMDGLKLYIKMAEQDRIKFLQSVDGADTSHEGVVRLYEKLLPYAVVLRMEKTWIKEMAKYYEYEDVASPSWYVGSGIFSAAEFSSAITSASSYIANSVSHSTSSSSSSSSSGGGGGGFSGGGGGGGGGGGW